MQVRRSAPAQDSATWRTAPELYQCNVYLLLHSSHLFVSIKLLNQKPWMNLASQVGQLLHRCNHHALLQGRFLCAGGSNAG